MLPTPERTDEPPPKGLRGRLRRLMQGENLSRGQARELLNELLDGEATDTQIAAALVALAVKGETTEELAGMAEAMRAHSTKIKSAHTEFIDTAGTGSSRAKTFNVSTAAAFVIAGAGLPVAKHGSRAATSRSGSADVLTALGVNVSAAPEISEKSLNENGICFMFAPLFHRSTARVAAVRRELGVHTTFNLLGPLTNPASAPFQIIGVWHEALIKPVAETLAALGARRAFVVHGADGLDEVTVTNKTFVGEVSGAAVKFLEISPEDFGVSPFSTADLQTLRGGSPEENARTILEVLRGEQAGAARALVLTNAAAALYVAGFAADLQSAFRLAQASLETGKALEKLENLRTFTNNG